MSPSLPKAQAESWQTEEPPQARYRPPQQARVVGQDREGRPLVQLMPNAMPVSARWALTAPAPPVSQSNPSVLVLFEEGDPRRPIIVGYLEDPDAPAPSAAAPLHEIDGRATAADPPAPSSSKPEAWTLDARVDGKSVRIEARDELVLSCGKATVTLRRNGKVIVRGTYVETHSAGTNRIKGGQVRIN